MTAGTALVLIGFGLGALIVAGRPRLRSPRDANILRSRALAAPRAAARAAQIARDLTARWAAEG